MYQTEHIKFDCQACSHFLIMNSYQERIKSHRMLNNTEFDIIALHGSPVAGN